LIEFPESIGRIAVGRRNCLAVSDTGRLFTVDHDFHFIATVKLVSPDILEELPTKRHGVVHIAAGWRYAAAVFKGIGLLVWKTERTEEERRQVISDNADGPTPYRERLCKARRVMRTEMETTEDRNLGIIGLMVGDGYLVYLTQTGSVHRVNVTDDLFDSTPAPKSFCLETFTTSPPLSYLSGSFDHFGLFNTAGEVLIGNHQTDADTAPEVIPGLQHKGIIALSWGDWHALALCEDGSILSWGRELNANGCLGLGYKNIDEARGMGLHVNRGEVLTPIGETRRVPGFGGVEEKFAFCVAAAGWHSAALVADFKVKEVRKREW
jgi:SCF-associated factor 1